MKRCLITGAGGFIGSNLLTRLASSKQYKTFGIFSRPPAVSVKGIESIAVDLSKPGWTEQLPEPVDIVFHLAQSSQYRDFPAGATDMVMVNILSTLELLEWSRKHAVKQFFFSSTANVFKPTSQKIDATFPCEPTSMYAASKLSAEHLIQQYKSFFQVSILRLFTIYGPGQRGMLVPSMIEKIVNKEEIFLVDSIGVNLTPLYISDCVDIMMRLIDIKKSKTAVYCVSGNDIVSLKTIVEIIEKYLDVNSNIAVTEGKPLSIIGNNQDICQEISFRPKIDIQDGLHKTIKEYIQNG